MRRVILSMMVSLDGYIEGFNNDISWHNWNEEMDIYMMEFFNTVDTFLYGRKSYELMIEYWPHQTGPFADIMNKTPKVVFSRTLADVSWNSRLVKEDVSGEVTKLRRQPGKDMVLFAGADIASTFIRHNLIDEYRLIVSPVVLGEGNPLFKTDTGSLNLRLTNSQTFDCGNVLLCYQPV